MPVPRASCEYAYGTLNDCRQRGRGQDYSELTLSELLGLPSSFSTASRLSLQSLSHHPGFNGRAYVRMCQALISSGSMPAYETFESAACSSDAATP